MKNALKHSFEVVLVLVLFLAFYLVMKGHIVHLAYYITGIAGVLYFVPYKIYRRMYMDTPHKKLYAVSSLVIAAIITISLLRVYMGGQDDLKTIAQVLFYVNIAVMLYCFLKAVEGRDYLAHFAMIFFTQYIINRF